MDERFEARHMLVSLVCLRLIPAGYIVSQVNAIDMPGQGATGMLRIAWERGQQRIHSAPVGSTT